MGCWRRSKSTPPPAPRRSVIGQVVLGPVRADQDDRRGQSTRGLPGPPARLRQPYVVVKRVKAHLLDNPKFRQFFDSEVQSMCRFNHPYIVQLLDASLNDPLGPA